MIKTNLNRSDYQLLGLYFTISTTLIFLNLLSEESSLREIMVGIPMYLLTTVLLIYIFIFWLIPTYLFRNLNYFKLGLFGLIVMAIIGSIEYTSWFWSINTPWTEFPSFFQLGIRGMKMATENTGLPLGILLIKKFYENQLHVSQLQQKQKESELKLLRSQISPHFLFNNLNTLDALIDQNTEKAKKYLAHLSALYRYLLSAKEKEVILVEDELEFARNYFYLIETRFGNSYQFKIINKTNTTQKYIVTGAIQTILENVVKHNKVMGDTPIKTTILLEENMISIQNNLSEASQLTPSFGTGLENLDTRCRIILHKKINIEKTDLFFVVKIPIVNLLDKY